MLRKLVCVLHGQKFQRQSCSHRGSLKHEEVKGRERAVMVIRNCAINIKSRCERINAGRFFSETFRRNSLSFFIIA